MTNLLEVLDLTTQLAVSIIVLLQTLIVYVLPPEQAEKYNFIGKALAFLASTRKGFSLKEDNGNTDNSSDSVDK